MCQVMNRKKFWKYVQSKSKVKQSVSSIQRPDGSVATDDSEIATVLNNFFSSVLTNENLTEMPFLLVRFSSSSLSSVDVSIDIPYAY